MSNVIELLMASLQYRVRAPAGQVRAWAHHRGVPALIVPSTAGWTLLVVLVEKTHVVGARPPATFEALRELHRLGQAAMIDIHEVWGAAHGTIRQLPDDYSLPEWDADWAGGLGIVVAAAGSDLSPVQVVWDSPMRVVESGGRNIVGADSGVGAGLVLSMVPPDRGPVVALDRRGEEVLLSVFRGGHLHGMWTWNPSRVLVCPPPPGLRLPVDVSWLYRRPDPRVVFQGAPGVDVDRLARAVAGRAPGATVVPELVAALGLPDFVADHLAGTRDLADEPGAVTLQPAKGVRGMLALRRFRRSL